MLVSTIKHGRYVLKRFEQLWKATNRRYFAFDTETEAISPYAPSDALVIGRAKIKLFSMCFMGESYSFPTANFRSDFPLEEDWGLLFSDWFLDPKIVKVMHNANYDINIVQSCMEIPAVHNFWCTMIGAWKASEWREKGLKSRANLYGRVLKATKTIDFNNLEVLAEYAEQDVIATDELYQMQKYGQVIRKPETSYVKSTGLWRTVENKHHEHKPIKPEFEDLSSFDRAWLKYLEFPTLSATIRAERRGLPFDMPKLLSIRKKLLRDTRHALRSAYRMAGEMFNPNSGKDLSRIFEELGIHNPYRTQTDRASFGAQSLNKMKGTHPFLDSLIAYKNLEKLLSVYVGTKRVDGEYVNADAGLEYFVNPNTGAIHCTMVTVGAITGRNSAQNPNLQQIPSRKDTYGIKTCFTGVARSVDFLVPKYRREMKLAILDYSQLEIRVMALCCKDSAMIKVLSDPKGDIHMHTAVEFGVPRQSAKNLNFLLLYAGEDYMLSETLTFLGVPTTMQQSAAFRARHTQVYPRITEYRQELLAELQEKSFVRLFTGRRRTLMPLVDFSNKRAVHKAETTISNNVIQGSGQDFLKAAIVRSDWRCINPDRAMLRNVLPKSSDHTLYIKDKARELEQHRRVLRASECNFRLQVHDEAIFTVLPQAAEECIGILAEIMSWRHYFPSIYPYTVPLVAEGGVGETWKKAKSDEAQFKTKAGFKDWERYK